MGGEKAKDEAAAATKRGSPPRGRGKANLQVCGLPSIGITPAWAGKRTRAGAIPGKRPDHPRVGGEKNSDPLVTRLYAGSPPRGRGKAAVPLSWYKFPGITPAWAGKSVSAG